MPVFQEFFGTNDESILQEFIGIRESLLQKIKNYYPRLFFPYNKIICPKWKLQSPKNDSKPCHHLFDLFQRIIPGDECSDSLMHYENENLEGPLLLDSWSGRMLDLASIRDVREVMASFKNVKELMDVGIDIKRSLTRHMRDISLYVILKCTFQL